MIYLVAILYLPIVTLVAFENVAIKTELSLQGMDLNIRKISSPMFTQGQV